MMEHFKATRPCGHAGRVIAGPKISKGSSAELSSYFGPLVLERGGFLVPEAGSELLGTRGIRLTA